ncbi:MAG: DNA-3-methyladenine glycosylase [Actinomycetota bacterium]|nr:DNA-3-methyladenine glycosylase [Actinomycetota bacterium]
MPRLPRRSLARPATEVAPELLGHVLARRLPDGGVLRARIVETEAYEQDDPASHAYRGLTPRVRVMFGPPGHLYVYFTYGMHHCMNVVTGPNGTASAVLLRAAQPLEGMDRMSIRRGTDRVLDLCRGPARLAQAFGVDRSLDGADLVRGSEIWIERDPTAVAASIRSGPRVGIRVGTDQPWRFWIDGPWVSVSRPAGVPSPR